MPFHRYTYMYLTIYRIAFLSFSAPSHFLTLFRLFSFFFFLLSSPDVSSFCLFCFCLLFTPQSFVKKKKKKENSVTSLLKKEQQFSLSKRATVEPSPVFSFFVVFFFIFSFAILCGQSDPRQSSKTPTDQPHRHSHAVQIQVFLPSPYVLSFT